MGIIRVVRNSAAVLGLGAAAGAAYITVRHVLNTPQPLTSGLPGEARIDRRHGGDLYYNVAGPVAAPPLLLLHDFYPGASNFEYRAVFSALADRFRVYAPDWLGFGMSEHSNIAYTGEFYAHVLTGFMRDVVAQPAIVVAHGRAANVAVRSASDAPDLSRKLVLITPEVEAGLHESPTFSQTILRLTQRAMLGLVPYAILSTMPALRWFSGGAVGPAVESEDLLHRYASAHQFGGHYAPLALLAGELDLPIRHVFPLLEQPSLIICGEEDPRHPPEEMEDLAILNPRADLDILPGVGTTVLEEASGEMLHLLDLWLRAPTLPDVSDDHTPIGEGATPPPPARPTHTAEAPTPNSSKLDIPSSSKLEIPSAPATSSDADVEPLGKAETDPQMKSLEQPGDQWDSDIPEVPVISAAADSEASPKIQDPIQGPREQRPTTRAAHRADLASVSTRVPLPTNTSGPSRSRGAARSNPSGNTARKRSPRSNASEESKQEE
jgi:pimeloyl-ACP methyl ester carboxylesterase